MTGDVSHWMIALGINLTSSLHPMTNIYLLKSIHVD